MSKTNDSLADAMKARGSLKIGDVLKIPAGVTQYVDTQFGTMELVLSGDVTIRIRGGEYHHWMASHTDESARHYFEGEGEYTLNLNKADSPHTVKITLADGTAVNDWTYFLYTGASHE